MHTEQDPTILGITKGDKLFLNGTKNAFALSLPDDDDDDDEDAEDDSSSSSNQEDDDSD